ncbi:exonuclease subunit SbcD [Pseudoalteromonas denitrificans]|uniref:Nuclease SbcCD subunit D n=1 Tax=Pseudoalteromonas denitrificans DSM 6059 TaxID=1123010 RepID=A0A1I1LFZ8_9GAMM|nr:exonuclease subunit SbcD [Pseudoalteromonas denitrificans]SFC72087.1 Exodeoxyribonuclease I subunit D [Pseudoalteromonas denitrificans DSM 6059]
MKILHTSDWHLGQHFIGKSRAGEHQAFITWLLMQIVEHKIDAVIIAGDVFDTGAPPSYAREIYNRFVVEINQLNCQLVVLGGNHDSVSTLNESKALLAYLNTQVIANVTEDLEAQIITLNHCHGDNKGKAGAILCAIPFIRPKDVMTSKAGESGADKQQALGQAIKDHYATLYQLAVIKKESLNAELPIVATGHLTALGVKTSDSVRDIYIGSLEAFSASEFPPADYIALGHIHRPQVVAKSEHIRYCGSPIPLSFDELGTDKQVLVAEFENGKLKQTISLKVPLFQPMAVIKGDLESIENQLKAFESHSEDLPVWLYIEVQTQDYLNDLQQRVSLLTADLHVEVLQLRRARTNRQVSIQRQQKEVLAELSPMDVFERRLSQEVFDTQDEQEKAIRITETFKAIVLDVQEVKA